MNWFKINPTTNEEILDKYSINPDGTPDTNSNLVLNVNFGLGDYGHLEYY
jgi:hypothetical protein